MVSIQKMCEHLSNKISGELNLGTDQSAVIHYGLFAIIQTVIAIFTEGVLGILLGVFIPTFIISLAGVILRKYSGGVHAQTPEECIVIGIIVSVGGAFIVSRISWNGGGILFLICIVFSMAYPIIWKLAPVDSSAKLIKKEEKKQQLKKKSILILNINLLICVMSLLMYLHNNNTELLVYISCICCGIGWQVFTLTNMGHLVMSKIDLFFNKLLSKKEVD